MSTHIRSSMFVVWLLESSLFLQSSGGERGGCFAHCILDCVCWCIVVFLCTMSINWCADTNGSRLAVNA